MGYQLHELIREVQQRPGSAYSQKMLGSIGGSNRTNSSVASISSGGVPNPNDSNMVLGAMRDLKIRLVYNYEDTIRTGCHIQARERTHWYTCNLTPSGSGSWVRFSQYFRNAKCLCLPHGCSNLQSSRLHLVPYLHSPFFFDSHGCSNLQSSRLHLTP